MRTDRHVIQLLQSIDSSLKAIAEVLQEGLFLYSRAAGVDVSLQATFDPTPTVLAAREKRPVKFRSHPGESIAEAEARMTRHDLDATLEPAIGIAQRLVEQDAADKRARERITRQKEMLNGVSTRDLKRLAKEGDEDALIVLEFIGMKKEARSIRRQGMHTLADKDLERLANMGDPDAQQALRQRQTPLKPARKPRKRSS